MQGAIPNEVIPAETVRIVRQVEDPKPLNAPPERDRLTGKLTKAGYAEVFRLKGTALHHITETVSPGHDRHSFKLFSSMDEVYSAGVLTPEPVSLAELEKRHAELELQIAQAKAAEDPEPPVPLGKTAGRSTRK